MKNQVSVHASPLRCNDVSPFWSPFPEVCVWGAVDPSGFANGMRWGWPGCLLPVQVGSTYVAAWSKDREDAYVWTVRGVTAHGVYITSPESRSPGHLLSEATFRRDYVPSKKGS